jgi:acetyltransferase-like isoleucine patch superfamily enzyme
LIKYILKNYSFKEFFVTIADEYLWSVLKHVPGIEGLLSRRAYLKAFSRSCGHDVVLERNVFIRCTANLSLGNNVFINRDVHLAAWGGIEIGDNAAIGPRVVVITNDHKFLTAGTNYQSRQFVKRPVRIGANSIIGANCYLNPGVTIGKNCIVAAGTAVFADIPDGAQVSGQVCDLYVRNMKKSLKNLSNDGEQV